MANAIDIAALKSSNNDSTNIDGKATRDFGNGLKEFDPSANGFEPEPEPERKSDVDRALEQLDEVAARKKEEVRKYNELLDQYGGEITEEELREELGQGFVTDALQDGVGGKFEENPDETKDVSSNVPGLAEEKPDNPVNIETPQSKELDELEQELEDEVNEEEPVVEPEQPQPNPVMQRSKKIDNSPSTAPKAIHPSPVIADRKDDDMSEEDKDLAALENDDEAPVDDFEQKLKKELEKKMRPVSKKYDLSNAVILDKPVTVSNMLSGTVPLDKKIFTWALMRTKRPIIMKSFSATELNILASASRNNSRSADVMKTIWEHIAGPCKGDDFHTWCKCTSYYDVDHIWFSIYGACYQDSNYLPFNCTSCNELTVTNDIPVYDMCKFAKPEYKEELERIKNLPPEPTMSNVFAEYLSQISDNIVIGFREPSIYDSVIVPTLLDSEFTRKYDDMIGLSAYIANIYQVSEIGNQVTLKPVSVKEFPNNEVKTLKARIIQYAKVIRSLTSDEYNIIMSYINHMQEDENITYGLPATTCDHCHKELPEERNMAADLVFMRHRLAILGA